jgi:hypothetical protein
MDLTGRPPHFQANDWDDAIYQGRAEPHQPTYHSLTI